MKHGPLEAFSVSRAGALLWIAFAVAVTGCSTSAQLNSFTELSKVGVAYVDAANAVIGQAADGSIAADTATLVVARDDASQDTRRQALAAHSAALKTQLDLFADIRRHESLVKEYFSALGALATAGDADSAIGTAASGTIAALGNVSKNFSEIKVGQESLADFAGQATPLVVASLRAGALERELRKNGATINRELLVSEGLMTFLVGKIKADAIAVQGPQEAQEVFTPYIEDGSLPPDWPARRAAFLQRSADLTAVASVEDAARKLRLALAAASENHLSPGQLQLLANDLNNLVDILEKIKHTP